MQLGIVLPLNILIPPQYDPIGARDLPTKPGCIVSQWQGPPSTRDPASTARNLRLMQTYQINPYLKTLAATRLYEHFAKAHAQDSLAFHETTPSAAAKLRIYTGGNKAKQYLWYIPEVPSVPGMFHICSSHIVLVIQRWYYSSSNIYI